jgi:4,5:9,10-diseco-3-hydroxy-5,9,17-trioxoandrosta-1(10),2-diene-4-oate hydrolase
MYPAGVPGLSARTITLRSGLRARVVEAGRPADPPVLLLPGWAGSAYLFRHNIPALAAAGLRAICLDLKGHGLSDKPSDPDEYTLESMAAFVLDAMDALGLARVVLVAQSMGGAVAAQVALSAPERVTALALLAPAGYGEIPGIPLVRRVAPPFLGRVLPWVTPRWLFSVILWAVSGTRARPTAHDVDEYFAPTRDRGFVRALFTLIRRFTWNRLDDGRLRALRAPLLVVFGEDDPVIPGSSLACYRRDVPTARTLVVRGAGHMLQEETPDEVNAAVVAFLGSLEDVPAAG